MLERETRNENRRPQAKPVPELSFEDRLSKFLKDSEERQSDVRRSFEAKRGKANRR